VGLKPSGGIRTLDDARAYLDLADRIMGPAWAAPATFRFGASGLHDALVAVLEGSAPGDRAGRATQDVQPGPGGSY
jgi:deoxyribose-phosphate aldolase